MPLRALRLLPLSPSSEASSLSFASTLQLAAGRAWSRRVTALSPLAERTRMQSHLVFSDSEGSPQAGPSDTKYAAFTVSSLYTLTCSLDVQNSVLS